VSAAGTGGRTPFHDLGRYLAIPRVTALRLSPDGGWLAAAVQTLAADGKKHDTSIWRIPAAPASEGDPGAADSAGSGGPARGGGPRRLTRSAEGEGNPRFLPDGSLLFTSKRSGQDSQQPDGDRAAGAGQAALWMLPGDGGEAVAVAALPGGVAAAEVAAQSGAIVLTSPVLPGAASRDGSSGAAGQGESTAEADARLRSARDEAGVTAILHESVPVRYWDHDLGPAQLRLFAAGQAAPDAARPGAPDEDEGKTEAPAALRDLTPAPGRALDQQSFDVSADGTTIATGWWRWEGAGDTRAELALIDVATATSRTLLSDPGFDYENPVVSPDGHQVACIRSAHHAPEYPGDVTIVLARAAGPGGPEGSGGPGGAAEPGGGRDLLAGFDRRPAGLAWAPDSQSVYFTADDQGRRPVFRVETGTGEIIRITADDGAYTDLCPAPDGRCLYALRSSVDEPPTPVRLEVAAGSKPARLASPGSPVAVPGRLEEIETVADDGTPIRSWLVLPETASARTPAPLLLWVHGGPMMSWNSWSWRWNPWLMAARGYAVLLPDPALSTGYGHDFIARAYHQWGARPFADLMAATDAAQARPDVDGSRSAMMGGSYGGYMANWIAGHTDRFKAIVSHASLWVLDQMFGTTDLPMFWRPQFGDPLTSPERYEANSPHRHVASIRTPMLVIHGNKDYRVPISEALRLWWDLSRHHADAKFLYFPDENHWILSPGHASVWYETVFAFLAQHVLGEPWRRPELL
jgi:dipeptidyl aminopeptidase/acylaminoacyl peptidase